MSKLRDLVDELGELNERITRAQMDLTWDQDRVKIMEAQLRAELAALPPDMPEIYYGARYGCKVGAAKQATKIKDVKAARRPSRRRGIA
jgi:hypothetical protein